MQFRLLYEGTIKPNGDAKEKHRIREAFHPQLLQLWQHLPLIDLREKLVDSPQSFVTNIIEEVGAFKFVPLVTKKNNLIAELDILLLRPEEPGKVIVNGDIDNLMKTLFDALRKPTNENEIREETPAADQSPFYCLLQDDSLITSVKVTADRLLQFEEIKKMCIIINVTVKATRLTWSNIGIG
jgi:hypothetical protein